MKEINNLIARLKNSGQGSLQPSFEPITNACVGIHFAKLDGLKIYMTCFNAIPNTIEEKDIDCAKASEWLAKNYKTYIKDCFYVKREIYDTKRVAFDDLYFLLFDDLLVTFDTNDSRVCLIFRKAPLKEVEAIHAGINKHKKSKTQKEPRIHLLINTKEGIITKPMNVVRPKLSIADNYNDDFAEVHRYILERLAQMNEKGIVLLHGKPGTGKTSYIRFLMSQLKKDIIFLPPASARLITDPDFINVLINNRNSILIIEDAEELITERDTKGRSSVSSLLNLCDGLLSDCLNIQVICSFNTSIFNVDKALLRKGRLIARYEFKELETGKAQALSDKLGFSAHISQPMILNKVYNQNEQDFNEMSEKGIGFLKMGVN